MTANDSPPLLADPADLAGLAARARAEGRDTLLEPEALALAGGLGLAVPAHRWVSGSEAIGAARVGSLPGAEVVVKAVAPDLPHKSDRGGLERVAKDARSVAAAMDRIAARLGGPPRAGYLVEEWVVYDRAFGGELLLGARTTDDFGPVVTLAPGGLHAERLTAGLDGGAGAAILSPTLARQVGIAPSLAAKTLVEILTRPLRGQPARLSAERLASLLGAFLALAADALPEPIAELEFNPVAVTGAGLVALDALVRLSDPPGRRPTPAPPRPLAKIARLLAPRSLAIAGVSRRMNPGRRILENVLAQGFPADRVWLVKPGEDRLAGCRCVPGVAALPERVDLLVVAVAAAAAPAILEEALAGRRAESLLLIPGGLGEREGSAGVAARLAGALAASRAEPGGGAVLNGGNCLGIRSLPGRYDSLFIPRAKLPFSDRPADPLALLSQSGAFAIARVSRGGLHPRYLVSLGNQLDLTLADYLEHLEGDPAVRVFGCYVEGFRPGDGQRFATAAARLARAGRPVLLYRGGRSAAGARASASHTASVAGDPAVGREICRAAGVVVAGSLDEFDDLLALFCRLQGRRPAGGSLGVLSNAGFECVAAADTAGPQPLADLARPTQERLARLFTAYRLDAVVEVQNPLDATPMLDDAGFAAAAEALLADPGVDLGVIGCVPLTGSLATLPAGAGHGEDLAGAEAVIPRLVDLWRRTSKPWVAVVDAGVLYDPAAQAPLAAGIPVFRTLDRAVARLRRWAAFWREQPEDPSLAA